jgi:hypothetical protein
LTPAPAQSSASAEKVDPVDAIDREAFRAMLDNLGWRISDRRLTEADLRALLGWIAASRWPRPESGAMAKLDRDAIEAAKATAAVAIRELHGGRFVDNRFAWTSADSINLKANLP